MISGQNFASYSSGSPYQTDIFFSRNLKFRIMNDYSQINGFDEIGFKTGCPQGGNSYNRLKLKIIYSSTRPCQL
jgi:hypothetical protein